MARAQLGANWAEVDLDKVVWTIPEHRMKAGREHRIPLSGSALNLLRALPRIKDSELLFPNTKGAALSDMTLTAVLRRMSCPVTAHGFRSTFRDWAGETTAYPREVIEHAPGAPTQGQGEGRLCTWHLVRQAPQSDGRLGAVLRHGGLSVDSCVAAIYYDTWQKERRNGSAHSPDRKQQP